MSGLLIKTLFDQIPNTVQEMDELKTYCKLDNIWHYLFISSFVGLRSKIKSDHKGHQCLYFYQITILTRSFPMPVWSLLHTFSVCL